MSHAVERRPIDICRARHEPRVIIGNAGVVRVLRTARPGPLQAGTLCLFYGGGVYDAHGYTQLAHGYDAPQTLGLLAKQVKVPTRNLFPLPPGSRHSPAQWAAFSVRYLTAWSNWRVALGALRLQLSEEDLPAPHVWGWGGGTALAELDLARRAGCHTVMITGSEAHRREIASAGVETLDRRQIAALQFDPDRYARDPDYAREYRAAEATFLALVRERTRGQGVSIFVDYIGRPVIRATLKALGRQGVITTAGWKLGMEWSVNRAMECLKRHIHVHTHHARLSEVAPAMEYAERERWMPVLFDRIYGWDEIPSLIDDYAAGRNQTYFPLFAVNPL
jgi:NADPH:quinone reductase-like Zn-dependent oxidoreductase